MIAVKFKSTPDNYAKEKDGRKPNTVRILETTDARWRKLADKKVAQIVITNTETGESFKRRVTDVTFWNGLWIISWRHVDGN